MTGSKGRRPQHPYENLACYTVELTTGVEPPPAKCSGAQVRQLRAQSFGLTASPCPLIDFKGATKDLGPTRILVRIAQGEPPILSTSHYPLGPPWSLFDGHGPNASMVAEFAYSAIRALQLIV